MYMLVRRKCKTLHLNNLRSRLLILAMEKEEDLPGRRVGKSMMISFRGIDDGEESSREKDKQENLHDLKLAATTATTVFVLCRKIDDIKRFHHIGSATPFASPPESPLAYCFTA